MWFLYTKTSACSVWTHVKKPTTQTKSSESGYENFFEDHESFSRWFTFGCLQTCNKSFIYQEIKKNMTRLSQTIPPKIQEWRKLQDPLCWRENFQRWRVVQQTKWLRLRTVIRRCSKQIPQSSARPPLRKCHNLVGHLLQTCYTHPFLKKRC